MTGIWENDKAIFGKIEDPFGNEIGKVVKGEIIMYSNNTQ